MLTLADVEVTWFARDHPGPVWMGRVVLRTGRPVPEPALELVACHVEDALQGPHWGVSVLMWPEVGELSVDILVRPAVLGY